VLPLCERGADDCKVRNFTLFIGASVGVKAGLIPSACKPVLTTVLYSTIVQNVAAIKFLQ
jgi:hypothetical protein